MSDRTGVPYGVHRILIAIVAACGGAKPAPTPTPPPAGPAAPLSCPGRFIDDVSGGAVAADGTVNHDSTCRDFPAECVATPTCECMKQLGYPLCAVDAKGQVTIVEPRPAAMPRSRQ